MPKSIAKYLNLPDPQGYTGHTFRRSATLLADSGGDITTLKKHGGCKSSKIAEDILINDSTNHKKQIFNQITESITSKPLSTLTKHSVNE